MEFDIELEGFSQGIGYFSVVGRPDLGYVYLTGQMIDELNLAGSARVRIEGKYAASPLVP